MADYVHDDGGRFASGRKGHAGDCVTRAIAIASGVPYDDVYKALADGNATQRATKCTPKRARSARSGVNVKRKWFKDYMASLGFEWTATMGIGTGCKVHLGADELPCGGLIVSVSKRYDARPWGLGRNRGSVEQFDAFVDHPRIEQRSAQGNTDRRGRWRLRR